MKGEIGTEINIAMEECHEDEDRGWHDVSNIQEMTSMARKPSDSRREAHTRLSLTALRRNRPCQHLDLGLKILNLCCSKLPSSLSFDIVALVPPETNTGTFS